MMRLSMGHVDTLDDRVLIFARQLGLSSIQLHAPNPPNRDHRHWTLEDLQALRDRCEDAGLRLEGIENLPPEWFREIQTGGPGRDQQIDDYLTTIRNMGKVGIPVLGYHFMVNYVWRTDMNRRVRGGARASGFDLRQAARQGNALASYKLTPPSDEAISAEQLWDNYRYFLEAVLPEAEQSGVKIALHPDDPPLSDPALGRAARIMTSPRELAKAEELAGGSSAWALTLCVGTVSEMGGMAAVLEVVRNLGRRGRIACVHLRDVKGITEEFAECFLGDGNCDPAAVMSALAASGFDGFVIDDHVPRLIGDGRGWSDTSSAAYCSRGRAHAIGYLQGVMRALNLDR